MAKKITGYIKLQVPAGIANPSRRRSARRWVSAASTSWNSARRSTPPRRSMEKGAPIPTTITVYADRSFSFETKTPPASFL
jgi:large subunit ribosomal protein L11